MTYIYVGLSVAGLFFLGLAAITGARLLGVRREAAREWTARREMGDREAAQVDERAFRRAYVRAYGPRGQIFALLAVASAAVLTPVALGLIALSWRLFSDVDLTIGEGTWAIEGELVWQFYMFFAVIGVWAGVAALFAMLFHRTRPGPLGEELTRARGQISV